MSLKSAMSSMSSKSLPSGPKMIWFYTGCILFELVAYGISTNINGPALVDLQFVYLASMEAMSYLASFFAGGYMLGSLVAWLMPLLNRQLAIALAMLLQAVSMVAMPHAGSIYGIYAVAAAYGFGGGAFDSSFNVWIVDMWPKASEPFLQAAAFSFGLGMIIGPLVTAPFVYGEIEVVVDVMTNVTRKITSKDRRQLLSIPYGLAGLIAGVVPVMLIVAYLIAPYRNAPKSKDEVEETEQGAKKKEEITTKLDKIEVIIPYRLPKLLLAICSLGFYGALEASFFSFYAAALQYLPVAMSAANAASVLSLAAITFSIGRALGILLSLRFSPDTLLVGHNTAIIGSLILIYVGRDNAQVIYVGTALLGLSFSAVWSALFSFTERHLRLTDGICSCFSFLAGALTLLMPFAISSALKSNPIVLFHVLLACALASAISFTLLKIFTLCSPRRG